MHNLCFRKAKWLSEKIIKMQLLRKISVRKKQILIKVLLYYGDRDLTHPWNDPSHKKSDSSHKNILFVFLSNLKKTHPIQNY